MDTRGEKMLQRLFYQFGQRGFGLGNMPLQDSVGLCFVPAHKGEIAFELGLRSGGAEYHPSVVKAVYDHIGSGQAGGLFSACDQIFLQFPF